jgi:amino acid adenylation domain-containing protein
VIYNLTQYLENAAEKYPEKTAFADDERAFSFAQLRKAARAAGAEIARRVGELRRPVAVLTRHTVSDVVMFYAALYAGCFYVPIDAEAPDSHIAARLEALSPALTIEPESFMFPNSDFEGDAPASLCTDSDPAYAIFTSGSTGAPKAAVIAHRSVINLTEWLCETFSFDSGTVFGNQTPFYFDASVAELFCTARAGATTHILPRKLFSAPLRLMRQLDELGVNTIKWATAAFRLVALSGLFKKYTPQNLKTVLVGGENLTGKYLSLWQNALPEVKFVNLYGPTETTVDCAYYIVDRRFADDEIVPIGGACRNTGLLLIDGQIAVRGTCVGLGYWGEPERTKLSFVRNPFIGEYSDTIYLTGDLAEYNSRGELVCLGRADSQVKHQGSRIELGEIEAAACALEGVDIAAVCYDKVRSKILLFYEGAALEEAVSEKLAGRLPHYMQPSFTARLDVLPRLPNGKIDRVRLAAEGASL